LEYLWILDELTTKKEQGSEVWPCCGNLANEWIYHVGMGQEGPNLRPLHVNLKLQNKNIQFQNWEVNSYFTGSSTCFPSLVVGGHDASAKIVRRKRIKCVNPKKTKKRSCQVAKINQSSCRYWNWKIWIDGLPLNFADPPS
jgi:hypothetical protein